MVTQPFPEEDGIVWEIDISRADYVREWIVPAATRRRPIAWRGPGCRVGYSVLRPDADSGGYPRQFFRRVFWLKDCDRYYQPNGTYRTGAPMEAVDPLTVAPGVPGRLTARDWGKALPHEEEKP
jgi:hypothetical protein